MIRYLSLFFLLSLIGFTILNLDFVTPFMDAFCLLLAKISGNLMLLFNANITLTDAVIRHQPSLFAIEVTAECSASQVSWLYVAALLPYPMLSWSQKGIALLLGLLVIQIVNVIRLISLVYFGAWFSMDTFSVLHEYVWPLLLNVVVLAGFMGVLFYCRPEPLPTTPEPAETEQ